MSAAAASAAGARARAAGGSSDTLRATPEADFVDTERNDDGMAMIETEASGVPSARPPREAGPVYEQHHPKRPNGARSAGAASEDGGAQMLERHSNRGAVDPSRRMCGARAIE